MQSFWTIVRLALEKTRRDNLVLTEEAASRFAQDTSVQTLRRICALVLDPQKDNALALQAVRELCLAQQLFFREQGISETSDPIAFGCTPPERPPHAPGQ